MRNPFSPTPDRQTAAQAAALGGTVPRPRGRIFYGWHIALSGAATNFLLLGITTFGFGVFVEPMRNELGWSLAAITFGYSIRSFQGGLFAPFMGALIDRYGSRLMALIGVFTIAAGLALFATAHHIWVYYLSSFLISLGQSTGGFTAFSTALMHWFQRRRGRAMGILAAGNGAGYLMAPILALLITAVGWRETLLIAAAATVLLGTPLAFVLRDRPEPYGYAPDGDAPQTEQRSIPPAAGMSVHDAVRTPAFYLLVLAVAVGAPTQIAWIVLQVSHLKQVGYSLEAAAFVAGLYGAVQIGLRFVAGWLADRFGRQRMYAACFLLQGVGLVLFAAMDVSRPWLIPLFLVTYSLGHGLFTVLFMTLTADYFGIRRFGTLRGLTMTLQTPLGVAAPLVAGWAFDQTGTYRGIFLVYAAIAASGALWVALIRRPQWSQLPAEVRGASSVAPAS